MSREQLHQTISDLLETLDNNHNRLILHEERISQLDIDVLRKQCIDLYDAINRLALTGKKAVQSLPEAVGEKTMETNVPEPAVVEKVEVKEEVAEVLKPETKEEKSEESVRKVENKVAKKDTKKADEEPRSIHKKLQEEQEMVSLFEKFNSKPIDSIAKAINISKRFEFQNNLFDGDGAAYKEFIDKIDSASNREAAFQVYHTYKNDLNWTNEDLKDEIKSLLYRKYSE